MDFEALNAMSMHDVVKELQEEGYELIRVGKQYKEVVLTNESLRIGIFHINCGSNFQGKILVTHEYSFSNWTSAYYKCDIPTNIQNFNMMLTDIRYIVNCMNISAAEEHNTLTRHFRR